VKAKMSGESNGAKRAKPVWFLETQRFTATWDKMRLSVDELIRLQDLIMAAPTSYPVVPGTGGLRKMRFAPSTTKRGKRGSLRVCYAYFHRFLAIVLVLVFSKNEKDDISPAEKKMLRIFLVRLEQGFEKMDW
jgi:hypothetical protein